MFALGLLLRVPNPAVTSRFFLSALAAGGSDCWLAAQPAWGLLCGDGLFPGQRSPGSITNLGSVCPPGSGPGFWPDNRPVFGE